MISGNMQATEQFYAQRIGADDFLKKPFGRGEVFTRLQKLIAEGRLAPQETDEPAPAVDEPSDIPDIAMPDPRDMSPSTSSSTIASPISDRPDV
jgi:twitching motility two-component system response regulator PilH